MFCVVAYLDCFGVVGIFVVWCLALVVLVFIVTVGFVVVNDCCVVC